MMKRLASILITITLCIALCAQGLTASALASEVTFSLSCTEGNVGDTVTVSVNITGDSGLTNATTYLHYNTAAVEFVKESVGSAATSCNAMFLVNNMPDEGYVKGGYVALYPAADAGVLLTFEFKVKSYTAAGFSLSFDECQGEDESGNAFDLNYKTTTCVLNADAGTTAPTKVNTTTKGNNAETTATAKTTAPTNGQGSAAATAPTKATAATTYPTDAHGITLTPEVVTQADGNAVTEVGGAVVTIATTSTTAVSTTTNSADTQGSDPVAEQPNGWLMPVIVIGILLLVAGGVTAVMLVMRKKKATK